MSRNGQLYWPSVGNHVAANGQFFMTAYSPVIHVLEFGPG